MRECNTLSGCCAQGKIHICMDVYPSRGVPFEAVEDIMAENERASIGQNCRHAVLVSDCATQGCRTVCAPPCEYASNVAIASSLTEQFLS